ncbi:hypothetical protein GH754_08510 [Salinibacillus xinjiangensis]|uniref:Uncharacterized protein n=1 Tax=Salinibacillus xinjiangensis TaxID=1229268 RepID=A0A6G1X616_9BACI|nr:hypothetical protein [Salinibacillus xinjiangensis]
MLKKIILAKVRGFSAKVALDFAKESHLYAKVLTKFAEAPAPPSTTTK